MPWFDDDFCRILTVGDIFDLETQNQLARPHLTGGGRRVGHRPDFSDHTIFDSDTKGIPARLARPVGREAPPGGFGLHEHKELGAGGRDPGVFGTGSTASGISC